LTRIRPGSRTDSHGNTLADWTTATSLTFAGWVEQQQATEDDEHRDALTTGLRLITNELDLTGYDRIAWNGDTYDIDGPPAAVATPAGTHHLEVRLVHTEG